MNKFFPWSPLQILCTTGLVMVSIEIVKFALSFAGPVLSGAIRAAGQ